MPVERVANASGRVELWAFDSDATGAPTAKLNPQFLGYEQPIHARRNLMLAQREAVFWSDDRTLGNVAISNDEITRTLLEDSGEDCLLGCDIVEAGKMRNGARRWWCRIHQRHWGTNADIARARHDGLVQCSNHLQPMSYVINPPSVHVDDYAEVGVWYVSPPALTNEAAAPQHHSKILVRTRVELEAKSVNRYFNVVSLASRQSDDLFANFELSCVHVTPPVALDFALGLEQGVTMGCVKCSHCGHPHMDLGEFGRTAHIKHLCGNCGRDNIWSSSPIVSTPLKPLHDQYRHAEGYNDVQEVLNIDEYPGSQFTARASLPALLWKSDYAQPRGIHVKLEMKGGKVIDDFFGLVIFRGEKLRRSFLLDRPNSLLI